MKLSMPKPTREMLPAIAPATTATRPSRLFHAMVKYSSRFPRRATARRVVSNTVTKEAYQAAEGRVNPAATQNPGHRSAMLSYFSLFTSLSTLLCCALPSLLVLFGLGASVAPILAFTPWLVALSRHKVWTFSISGTLIGLSFVNMYYIVPSLKGSDGCDVD